MPDIKVLADRLAGALSLLAFVIYIFPILKGEVKPNRATWFIWTVVGFMLAASYFSSSENHNVWAPITYAVTPLVIAILSIKYGEGGWTQFDRYCLLGAGVSVLLWWMFNSPLLALLINLIIDFLGLLPTVGKVYREPKSEPRATWLIFFLANITSLFAVQSWTFAVASYPVYMFLATGLVIALMFTERNQTAQAD